MDKLGRICPHVINVHTDIHRDARKPQKDWRVGRIHTSTPSDYDDDTLVVDRSVEPRPGHIIVAMVDGEITVKRYELRGDVPCLCSGNPRYAPIPLVDLECQVWGVVRSVIHEYPV